MHVLVTTEDVLIKDVKLVDVRKTEFLGVVVDGMLSWSDYISTMKGEA